MIQTEYTDKFVAFIDVLGFSDIINQTIDENIRHIETFNQHISHVLEIIKVEYERMFSIKMFSGCICVSCKKDTHDLQYLLTELSYVQLYFSTNGIFIRGGLSQGPHFENENMIYSKGLIRAYELERQANYPRILIEDELAESLRNADHEFIMKSPDGRYFLDYLDFLYQEGMGQEEFLQFHKESIINQINQNLHNPIVLDKYKWLSEYHNNKFREFFSKDDYFEDPYIEIENKLLIKIEEVFPKFEK